MKAFYGGRINSKRKLIKREHQDDTNDLDDKDIVRWTINKANNRVIWWKKQGKFHYKRTSDHLPPSGYFWGQANLHTGNVSGYYYKAQQKVTYNDPPNTQIQLSEESLLNQRIKDTLKYHLQIDHIIIETKPIWTIRIVHT